MRAAIIIDGKVDNIIEVDALDALEGVVLVEAPTASIGDLWDGESFATPPAPPAPPPSLTVADYEAAVDKYLDDTAYLYGYNSLISAITYADEPAVPAFQVEGQAFRACRSLTWAKCREVLTAYENGERTAPTIAELLAELPPLELPPPTLGRSV